MNKFDREIAASVRAESRRFDMARFVTRNASRACTVATCKTATCLAGHVVAIRRKLALALMDLHPTLYSELSYRSAHYDAKGHYVPYTYIRVPVYGTLAAAIYRIETGKDCDLGFFGTYSKGKTLDELTRKDALLHLAGKHPTWPRQSDLRPGQ